MGSESIAHSNLRPHGLLTQRPWRERNNCFSKIQLVGQKYRDKTILAKRDSAAIVLVFKAGAFRHEWAITYSLVVAQPIRTQH